MECSTIRYWIKIPKAQSVQNAADVNIQIRTRLIPDEPLRIRANSRLASSTWETSSQSNTVSHWLSANLEWVLTCGLFRQTLHVTWLAGAPGSKPRSGMDKVTDGQIYALGLALLTLSWDKNWDSHSLVNGYPSFYPRMALVAPSPGVFIILKAGIVAVYQVSVCIM